MEDYLIKTLEEVIAIYIPDLTTLDDDDFIPPNLRRTHRDLLHCLRFTVLVGNDEDYEHEDIEYTKYQPGNPSYRFRGLDENCFWKTINSNDFDLDITGIVTNEEDRFLRNLDEKILSYSNETSVKLLLIESVNKLREADKELKILEEDASKVNRVVITKYLASFGRSITFLKNKYGPLYPLIFTNFDSREEDLSVDGKEAVGGLFLANSTISPGRAEKLCKWLKKANLIDKDTKFQTILNVFVKKKKKNLTKVKWSGTNRALKYFIECLHEESILKESAYNNKWKDVASTFINSNGKTFTNKQFSKNTEPLKSDVQEKIDAIILKLKSDLEK